MIKRFAQLVFASNRVRTTLVTMKVKRVCVIGAGAAGLIAISHIKKDPTLSGRVFEQGDTVGGIWKYTENTGNDKYGIPVHSTAYKGLRTNLPKEIMGYLDYPFPATNPSYISHLDVLGYLEKFADDNQLTENIHFATRVINVKPANDDASINTTNYWKITTENLKTKEIVEHGFDAILVCNGHYTKPYFPEIKDLNQFQGEIWHSRDYRTPDCFTGKRVIVLGGGPSAIDISIELGQCASQVMLSCKSANYDMPKNINLHTPVVAATSKTFVTMTGEELECDAILLCSGYVYDFPFLSPTCDISVEKGKYVYPLYRHLINAKRPSMAFIGIPFTVCPFPQFDVQIRYFLKALKEEINLPSEDDMICEIRNEEERRREQSVSFNHSHKFGDVQWSYNKQLAEDAGFTELIKPVIQKVYDKAGERRVANPANYKYDYVKLIDNEHFEYIEDLYLYDKSK